MQGGLTEGETPELNALGTGLEKGGPGALLQAQGSHLAKLQMKGCGF